MSSHVKMLPVYVLIAVVGAVVGVKLADFTAHPRMSAWTCGEVVQSNVKPRFEEAVETCDELRPRSDKKRSMDLVSSNATAGVLCCEWR